MSFDLVSATQSLFTANDRTNRLSETERETDRQRVRNCTPTASEWTTALPRGEASILPTERVGEKQKEMEKARYMKEMTRKTNMREKIRDETDVGLGGEKSDGCCMDLSDGR